MLSALDAAEEDLRSEAVPIRARGVVTLTRLMRATLESGAGGSHGGGGVRSGGAWVGMDIAVAQRLMDTYARMAGDADSYVFRAAVQGLAALADALPGWCIPRLVGIFAGFAPDNAAAAPLPPSGSATTAAALAGVSLPLSQRLKIGEAVLLSARRCGEAMPKYARFYVNAFVTAARERSSGRTGPGSCVPPKVLAKETESASAQVGGRGQPDAPVQHASDREREVGGKGARGVGGEGNRTGCGPGREESENGLLESKERYHFRASCLSNLAEVCQLLRWSLGRFSQDIVDLGVGILSMETGDSEEAALVRRGAAFLLGQLLRGAGRGVHQIVPTAELRAAYRALKRAAERDGDEVTRSHARSGLSCLDVAIRGQRFTGGDSRSRGEEQEMGMAGGVADGEASSSSSSHHPGITVL